MAAVIKDAQRSMNPKEALMERRLPKQNREKVKSWCPQHHDRCPEFFCGQHNQLCCNECKFSQHGKCADVKSVKDVSRNITESKVFKTFNVRLNTIKGKTEEILKDAKEKMKLVSENHDDIVDAVKQMRRELNEALDEVEKDMLQRAKTNKEREIANVLAVSDKFMPAQIENLELMKQMKVLQENKQKEDMFILMKEAENKLKSAEDMLASVSNDIKVKGFTFLPNQLLLDSLRKPDAMGKFLPHIWMEHMKNINIKTDCDTCRCWVTSITALPDKLIALDRGNSKLKVIDADNLTVTSELTLASRPWAGTKIDNQKVAITLPYVKKIAIIRTNPIKSIEKEIGTSNKCHGIAYCDSKFIVTFNKMNRIDIIRITGNILHAIHMDNMTTQIISCPEYVTLSPNNQVAYVSNYLSNTVARIGLDGTMRGMYKDDQLIQPRQTQVYRNGIVFVCGFGSQNIHLISQDLKKIKILSTGLGKLHSPRTICLSNDGDKLFVDHSPDYISVFTVSRFLNGRTPKLNASNTK